MTRGVRLGRTTILSHAKKFTTVRERLSIQPGPSATMASCQVYV